MDNKQTKSHKGKAKQSLVKMWTTEVYSTPHDTTDPSTLARWRGPKVPGDTAEQAQAFCEENGLGYCKVIGEAV